MIVIRRPVGGDAEGVGQAWEGARQFYSDLDSRTFLPPDPEDVQLGRAVAEYLTAGAELPGQWIRVAEVEGEAVGFITATLHEPIEDAARDIMRDSTRRHIKIDTLVVQRSHWGTGVGRALVESVEGWANQVEASPVKVGTYARSPAVRFYEALGYDHRSIIFEKYLD